MPVSPPSPDVRPDPRLGLLGRLAGSVAHDFNNLLGTISNNAHVLCDLCTDAEARQLLDSTLRAVEAGSRLTQQLLRLAHHRPRPPQRIELARQLPGMLEVLQGLLGRRISLGLQVDPDVPDIHADADELELALLALGLDARDAMPRGARLHLQAARADAADLRDLPASDPPRGWVKLQLAGWLPGPAGAPPQGRALAQQFCEQAGGAAREQAGASLLLLPSAPG